MTDQEFLVVLSLRRIPQRESHFRKLGEDYEQALGGLVARGLVERVSDPSSGLRLVKLTTHGRQQAHAEWIHRGKPTLEQLLAKGPQNG